MMRNPQRKARHALVYIILAGLMLAATACANTFPTTLVSPTEPSNPPAAASESLPGTLSGTVTYRQRIALAPDAVVEVTLQDVSKADAPAEMISTQKIETNGAQVPIAYTLCEDHEGRSMILFPDEWPMRYFQQKNQGIELSTVPFTGR